MRIGFLAAILILVAGCGNGSFMSMNVQRSGLRAGTDLGVTVYLDSVESTSVVVTQNGLRIYIGDVERFLNGGNVADLPLGSVVSQIVDLVPARYHSLFRSIVAAVKTKQIDVNAALGKDNLARMRAALHGMKRGVEQYNKDHRRVVPSVE